jgi:hypothetical protein
MATTVGRTDLLVPLGLVVVGVGAWLHWSITDPSFEQSATQSEWPYLLAFSGLIILLAVGAAALARAISGSTAVRAISTLLLGVAVAGATTNVVEDGFGVEQAFVVFVLSTALQLLALVALAVALAVDVVGARRVLAAAPLASAAGIVLYVHAGGPILLATWCSAAVVLVLTGRRGRQPSSRTVASP